MWLVAGCGSGSGVAEVDAGGGFDSSPASDAFNAQEMHDDAALGAHASTSVADAGDAPLGDSLGALDGSLAGSRSS
jgi:hypothetical protein